MTREEIGEMLTAKFEIKRDRLQESSYRNITETFIPNIHTELLNVSGVAHEFLTIDSDVISKSIIQKPCTDGADPTRLLAAGSAFLRSTYAP